MLTRILALVAVLLLAPSTLAHANARALSLESASLGIFARNVDLLKEIPDLTHCCIKEKSTEPSESSNRREEYLRARYMDPGQGRFLGMDPWEGDAWVPGSLHRFAYANQAPVTFVDPSGKQSLIEISIATNANSAMRTTSVNVGRRTIRKVLFGHPPKEVGIVGEMVLDWMLQGFFDHFQDSSMTRQEFGQRVHADVRNRCDRFMPLKGVSLSCEPFFMPRDATTGVGLELDRNPKGTLGVDILIKHGTRRVIALAGC